MKLGKSNFWNITILLVPILVSIGITGIASADGPSIDCEQKNDSYFDMVLDCTDTIDVKKSAMEYMYNDINKFSTSFEGAKVYNIEKQGTVTFATLEIPLPVVSDLRSDVKFTKSSNYLLEFQNGKLKNSELHITVNQIDGYDGTKNGGSLVHFLFKVKEVPCFGIWPLKQCGSAENFEYALDKGLYLLEPEAKKIEQKLDLEKQSTQPSAEPKEQETTETKTEQVQLRGPPRIDSDNDGISDSEDHCKLDKETFNGYRDSDGCPDSIPKQTKPVSDNDSDGITNDKDLCPNEPEDHDGDRDSDGCPDPTPQNPYKITKNDHDGDGIPNSEDSCPTKAEVRNGYIDWDGCPDNESGQIRVTLDDDDDGIMNHLDQCPNMKEVHNGFKDADGCPDAVMQSEDTQYQKTEPVKPIPDWVKNNAKWYSVGSITEREFSQSIQYMIKDEIIHIEKSGKGSDSQFSVGQIPKWVQNSAGWWADGQMSNKEFVKTIQYLVDLKIIDVY